MSRPLNPSTKKDLATAQGMLPAGNPHDASGRRACGERGRMTAYEIATAYNSHFTTVEWNVVTVMLGMYSAISDGARRPPRTSAEGWTPRAAARAYVPDLAPDLTPIGDACIVRARIVGHAAMEPNERLDSPQGRFVSAHDPQDVVIGTDELGHVEYAMALARREREACLWIWSGTRSAWGLSMEEHPDPYRAMIQALLRDGPEIDWGDFTLWQGIAILGDAVGMSEDSFAAARSLLRYSKDRWDGGARPADGRLLVCPALGCTAPLFVWARAPRTKRGGSAAPTYCTSCATRSGDFPEGRIASRSANWKARDRQRRRRQQKSG